MTQSLLNLQNAQPKQVRDGSPESTGAFTPWGQAAVFVHESYCSGSNIRLQNLGAGLSQLYCHGCNQFIPIMQQFGKPGSAVHASQTPSATPSGEALRNRGIKRVSSNNAEWMRKALNVFGGSKYAGFLSTFTGWK